MKNRFDDVISSPLRTWQRFDRALASHLAATPREQLSVNLFWYGDQDLQEEDRIVLCRSLIGWGKE